MIKSVGRVICAQDLQWLLVSKCAKRSRSTIVSEVNKTLAKPKGWDEAKPFEELPGPKRYPLIGNIWRFMPVIGDLYGLQGHQMFERYTCNQLKQFGKHKTFYLFIFRFYKEYGDIMCLQGILNSKPIAVLFNPQAIETVSCNYQIILFINLLRYF